MGNLDELTNNLTLPHFTPTNITPDKCHYDDYDFYSMQQQ